MNILLGILESVPFCSHEFASLYEFSLYTNKLGLFDNYWDNINLKLNYFFVLGLSK